jgi:hypothetical protein
MPRRTRGDLRFLGSGVTHRVLHIRINSHQAWPELVALLGHELQHAFEVAEARDVRCGASFRRHYQRIGWVVTPGHYETARAKKATADIRCELASARRPPISGAHDLRPTDGLVRRAMPVVSEPVGETTDRDPLPAAAPGAAPAALREPPLHAGAEAAR